MKLGLSKRLKHGIKSLIMLFLIFAPSLLVQASTQKNQIANITIEVKSNGVPMVNKKYAAIALDTAYKKILNGTITSTDVSSAAWQEVSKTGEITVDGNSFGAGIKNSKKTTLQIIKSLLEGKNIQLLEAIQGITTYAAGQSSGYGNIYIFHNQKNISKNFTDFDGRAEVGTPQGFVAIISAPNLGDILNTNISVLKMGIVDEDKNYQIDTDNLDNRLSVEIKGLPKSQEAFNREYTVEYGQEVTYEIKLAKSLISDGGNIEIDSQPNLVIDDASISLIKSEEDKDITDADTMARKDRWTAATPPIQKAITLIVKAHLQAEKQMENGVALSAVKHEINRFSMQVTYQSPKETVTALSPFVDTTGENFIIRDKKKMTTGYSYVLGKTVSGKNYLYDNRGKWKKVNKLNGLDFTNFLKFQGGYQYAIGEANGDSINFSKSANGYKRPEAPKVEKSVLKIVGLKKGQSYFLYQVSAPNDATLIENKYTFIPTRTRELDKRGTDYVRASFNMPTKPCFDFDGQIPDYSPGIVEYTDLSAAGQTWRISAGVYIVGMIMLSVLGVFAVGLVLFRRY